VIGFGLAVKLHDRKRRLEEEAVAVQSRVSDALLMDPTLGALPLTPTAQLPFWTGSPIIVEIAGVVPRRELGDAAVALTTRELARSRSDFRIENRISVDPRAVTRAA
jgi:hypothetical protein